MPGWDTHGLPIELKAMKKVGVDKNADVSPGGAAPPLPGVCADLCGRTSEQQFKRLGVLGDFDDPYLTLKPEFEAKQIEIFGEMAKKGYIYKGLKPVYWCPECSTALAEAEIEYAEDPCHSIYVKFQVTDDKGVFSGMGIDPRKRLVRHLDHHHLDPARQRGHLPGSGVRIHPGQSRRTSTYVMAAELVEVHDGGRRASIRI